MFRKRRLEPMRLEAHGHPAQTDMAMGCIGHASKLEKRHVWDSIYGVFNSAGGRTFQKTVAPSTEVLPFRTLLTFSCDCSKLRNKQTHARTHTHTQQQKKLQEPQERAHESPQRLVRRLH